MNKLRLCFLELNVERGGVCLAHQLRLERRKVVE